MPRRLRYTSYRPKAALTVARVLHVQGIMHNLAINDRKKRADLSEFVVGNREVITIQHSKVSQFARLDAAGLFLHSEKPAIVAREKADGFSACELLPRVHLIAE